MPTVVTLVLVLPAFVVPKTVTGATVVPEFVVPGMTVGVVIVVTAYVVVVDPPVQGTHAPVPLNVAPPEP